VSQQGAAGPRSTAGRPVSTSHVAIEEAAFRLFAERGFERTTLAAIADEVGVGRRTLFRYFASKNDIPWGRFDQSLEDFADTLSAMPDELPLWEAVHRAVLRFNDFDADARPSHRDRMLLILGTPALEAHSVLRYAQWRAVIAGFVADRRGLDPDDLLPRMVGQVSLALTLSSYGVWLQQPGRDLLELLDGSMATLRDFLAV
jgi:mycofactocin system transcriptional regulator